MHLGNLACALVSYLSAKSKGGTWLLRIEDLDPGRSRYEYARILEEDLHTLGLDWDEGGLDAADADGESYCQSKRSHLYAQALEKLSPLTYPCYCSRADILASQAPHESDGGIVYGGTCRPKEGLLRQTPPGDRPHSTRIIVPDRDICFEDGIFGAQRINLTRECGDFIVRRSDGVFAYQLAVVVDDALMGVSEVVRGRDLLRSTALQLYLYECLGLRAPQFFHLPLLCAPDGRRLCKRDEAMDIGRMLQSHSPQEITGSLAALLGIIQKAEPCRPCDLIPLFDCSVLPREDVAAF